MHTYSYCSVHCTLTVQLYHIAVIPKKKNIFAYYVHTSEIPLSHYNSPIKWKLLQFTSLNCFHLFFFSSETLKDYVTKRLAALVYTIFTQWKKKIINLSRWINNVLLVSHMLLLMYVRFTHHSFHFFFVFSLHTTN